MTEAGGRIASLVTAIAIVAGVCGAFASLPAPDPTWLLHVAGVLLDGGRLGADVVENSPPVILWLKVPVVLLARTTGLDSWLMWVGVVSLLAGACVWESGRLLRRVPTLSGFAGPLQAVVALGLFLLPGQEFGQREHVAICLALPWLLASAALAEGAPMPRPLAWALSLVGGLGLAIKPHFALPWFAVAGVLGWRARSGRRMICAEVVGPILVAMLAAIVTLMLHPQWLNYARSYGPLYARYEAVNPLWVGLVGEGAEWSWLGFLSLLAFTPGRGDRSGTQWILVAALAGFHAAAAVQMKGWPYHFLPAGMLGLTLSWASGASTGWRRERLIGRVYRVGVVVGMFTVAWGGIRRAVSYLTVPETRWAEADPSLRVLLEEVRRSGRRETLLMVSTNIGSGWPLAHMAHAAWTMRHPSLWVLAGVYRQELRGQGMVETRSAVNWTAEEQRMVQGLGEDVAARAPTIVALPRGVPMAEAWDVSRRFRYEEFLTDGAIPGLADCLSGEPRTVGAYLLWRCMRSHESPSVAEDP